MDRKSIITRLTLKLPNLHANFNGFRLVQISDIHFDGWMNRQRLEGYISLVNDQQPDLVVITGDFVSRASDHRESGLAAALSKIQARFGAAAVLGNHDHWSDPQMVRRALKAGNVRDLSNRFITLERQKAQLHIAGVDDIVEKLDRLDLVLNSLPESGSAILLAHEPDYADTSAASGRFDLQLSGHSHGGQVILPLIGALYLPRMGRIYPSGLYQVGAMYQYTNRGLGMTGFHLRLNCRPEVTVFTLEPGLV